MSFWDPDHKFAGEPSGDPGAARTYVLAIGTSRYQNLPEPSKAGLPPLPSPNNIFGIQQVSSPAISAFSVADWFYREYTSPGAELGGVWLLLSASDEEKADNGLKSASDAVGLSNSANTKADLIRWRNACAASPGSVAVLYASGHGIAISQDDAFVLLEDFNNRAVVPAELDAALDIGLTKRRMIGPTMAQTQLYFSDACRLQVPGRLDDLGNGIGPPRGELKGADTRSLVIYFSATPNEAAQATPGKGTLFSQALLDSLRGGALTRPTTEMPKWHISTASLTEALTKRMAEIEAANRIKQDLAQNSQGKPAVIHVPTNQPKVTVTIEIKPPPFVSKTFIELWDGDRRSPPVRARQAPPAHPFQLDALDPGLYSLDIDFDSPAAPFAAKTGLVVNAQDPPSASRLIEFP